MSESIVISRGSKSEKYESLIPQIAAIIEGETHLIANLANICAALKMQFGWWWVGFYLVDGEELILGPFQGPIACTRIKKGKGVCGSAWLHEQTLIVPDVNNFPGHIACSADSQSEIVLPFRRNGEILGVLDVDSELLAHFDQTDKLYLEKILTLLSE